jgi:catechol 2,3-dioxygenase-like lactoylglutathione lyase family enzyme
VETQRRLSDDETIAAPSTAAGARLLRSAAYFPVGDVGAATKYYETVLGFRCDYSAGAPAQFAIVSRDGLSLMFRRVDDPGRISPNERQGGTWDTFFWVDAAEALCEEFSSRGAEIVYGPVIQAEYHMKEFAVRDPYGYVLGFGQEWR